MDLSLFLPPLVACLVIVAIHSYLGPSRHRPRGDLRRPLAGPDGGARLGGGHPRGEPAGFDRRLRLCARIHHARRRAHSRSPAAAEKGRVPQEAIIGIVYVMASAAAILVADRTPRGGEAIKDILVGSLLWVTWPTILRLAGVYAVIGLFHWVLRRRFLTISFHPETAMAKGWSIRWWDFLFYLSFGIVITFSVPIAGVLLVFSFLVVPAAIAFQFTRRQGALAIIAWLAGALASAAGLLGLVPLRPAHRADRRLHVRTAPPRRVRPPAADRCRCRGGRARE